MGEGEERGRERGRDEEKQRDRDGQGKERKGREGEHEGSFLRVQGIERAAPWRGCIFQNGRIHLLRRAKKGRPSTPILLTLGPDPSWRRL